MAILNLSCLVIIIEILQSAVSLEYFLKKKWSVIALWILKCKLLLDLKKEEGIFLSFTFFASSYLLHQNLTIILIHWWPFLSESQNHKILGYESTLKILNQCIQTCRTQKVMQKVFDVLNKFEKRLNNINCFFTVGVLEALNMLVHTKYL